MSDPFLCGLLADIEAEIKAAMLSRLDTSGDGIFMYSFNSGQTVQSVTKLNLKQLDDHISHLLAQRDTLRQRCGLDSGSFNAGAAW